MALGGSGCSGWLSTTFVSGVKATASTAAAANHAAMTSQGMRTTRRPSNAKAPMPALVADVGVIAAGVEDMVEPFIGVKHGSCCCQIWLNPNLRLLRTGVVLVSDSRRKQRLRGSAHCAHALGALPVERAGK